MRFNPFAFREIELRGLVAADRAADTVRIMQSNMPGAAPVAPQDDAEDVLPTALLAAEASPATHQIQRAIRAGDDCGLMEISTGGQPALQRHTALLAPS